MKYLAKKSEIEMFATNIFPHACQTNIYTDGKCIPESLIPDNGFYDIRASRNSSACSGLELVVDNGKVDIKRTDLLTHEHNKSGSDAKLPDVIPQKGPVTINRERPVKRSPPPKPPRLSKSSTSSTSSLISLDNKKQSFSSIQSLENFSMPLLKNLNNSGSQLSFSCSEDSGSLTTLEGISSTGSQSPLVASNQPFKEKKVCTNCPCDKTEHEIETNDVINSHKMKQLTILDSNDNGVTIDSTGQYLWMPPGLSEDLADQYFSFLPRERVPHFNNPEGIKYHNKQLILQIPLQDSNMESITTLSPSDTYILDSFKRERDPELSTGKVLQADKNKKCDKCDDVIHEEDMYVSGGNSNLVWHPACFTCFQCNELLADLVYGFRNKRIFCARHHAEQIKPRCVMCDELIFGGEYVRTEEKAYHSQHFICCYCERGLTGEQHLVDRGLPICIQCYDEKYSSICHMCGKTIGVDDEDVIYDDEHWHDTCLVCSLCTCKLSGTSFVVKDDKFLCSECYQKTDDKRCKRCEKGFEPGAKRLELKGDYWHETCFVCENCKAPITSKRFIHHEGKQICCPCFDSHFAKRCGQCDQVLREGGVACGGLFYHRDCFNCFNCSVLISNQPFQQKDGKRYCTPCYKDLFAKCCTACGDHIINGEFYTVDTDNWHKECFRCIVCQEMLVRQSFVQENGVIKLVCTNCQ